MLGAEQIKTQRQQIRIRLCALKIRAARKAILYQIFGPSVFLDTKSAACHALPLSAKIGPAAPEPFHETHTF